MRTAVLNFGHPIEFQKAYLRDFPHGGLFIETDGDFFLGERLRIISCFPEIPEGIGVNGTIVWRRAPTKSGSTLKPGIGVGVDEMNKEQIKFLLNYSSGQAKSLRGKSRRIPAGFPVDFAGSQEWRNGNAMNISRDGLFILTEKPVAPDTALKMKLYLEGGSSPESCLGRVAWQCGREPETGMGVEFQFKNEIQRIKIVQYVERSENMLLKRFPSQVHLKLRPVTTTS